MHAIFVVVEKYGVTRSAGHPELRSIDAGNTCHLKVSDINYQTAMKSKWRVNGARSEFWHPTASLGATNQINLYQTEAGIPGLNF
jgi:hypothetical protein